MRALREDALPLDPDDMSWLWNSQPDGEPRAVSHKSMQAAPVFLIGCHRSGTTLMRYLLDAHPNLACPPESKFLAALHEVFKYPQAVRVLASLGIPV